MNPSRGVPKGGEGMGMRVPRMPGFSAMGFLPPFFAVRVRSGA